ncbi:MAG: hypothetical protein FJ317_00225 [SAR202 cluster bacterium]|nr:hypothetical protein [SAR202 cluster bacterium]
MKLISFEGCTGSGKTTLAYRLGDELGAVVVLESYDDIPTLNLVGRDPDTFGFSTAVEFTNAHAGYLKAAMAHPVVVTDFTMARDLLFAGLNFQNQPDSRDRYRQYWKKATAQLPAPDYVVLLEAPPEVLLNRAATRGRPFEASLTVQTLAQMSRGFQQLYAPGSVWGGARLVERLDTTDFDRADREMPALAQRIRKALGLS